MRKTESTCPGAQRMVETMGKSIKHSFKRVHTEDGFPGAVQRAYFR